MPAGCASGQKPSQLRPCGSARSQGHDCHFRRGLSSERLRSQPIIVGEDFLCDVYNLGGVSKLGGASHSVKIEGHDNLLGL